MYHSYLGHKAPSLKMQTVGCFVVVLFVVVVVVGIELSRLRSMVLMLIGSRT